MHKRKDWWTKTASYVATKQFSNPGGGLLPYVSWEKFKLIFEINFSPA
jgi:hypothetical protein